MCGPSACTVALCFCISRQSHVFLRVSEHCLQWHAYNNQGKWMACVQTTHQTAHGQLLDITTAPIGTVNLSKYTEPTYMRIVTFKTAFYSFYLPVVCGLLVGGVTSQEAFGVAKDICIQMGQYFQVALLSSLSLPFWDILLCSWSKMRRNFCSSIKV